MQRTPAHLRVLLVAAAILLALLAIGPTVWLVAVAVSTTNVPINRLPPPGEVTLDNFRGAWSAGGLLRPLLNSVVVTVCQAGLNVLLAAAAAYPLARMQFRGRDTVFLIILATLMIPEQVIVVPLFRTVVNLGLYDTLAGVVIPFSVTAFGIYLCRQAMISIPREMDEAAAIDGATAWQVFRHVMLPLSAPTLATLGVFSVIGAWSNLLWPLIVLQEQQNYTLPVALNQLMGVFAANIRYAYAGSVLALIPIVLFYVLMQRYLQRGLLAGAVKG
ncbi:MAG: carbohydrate ABC transporter permease [Phycisphaerae bacterium]|nr:carbohydrate ABC transporter permease [Phycisphaerae bacterium]MDW8261705.1 carbohydrate ABC transporter permease [Phycisphaerales bacterium]